MPLDQAQRVPVSTYRLQLHGEFGFQRVEALLPYLQEIGISDCYLSPIFLSAPGSQHGYDVNDYRKIDPELGGGEGFQRLAGLLSEREMGVLLDFVPNHMGIDGPFNPWWRDVLECGRHSPYAEFFDIYWQDDRSPGGPRVLLSVLDDHYGNVLEQGRLKLFYHAGELWIGCGEMRFPIRPRSYGRVLGPVADEPQCPAEAREELRPLTDAFIHLPHPDAAREPERAKDRSQQLTELKQRLSRLCDHQPKLLAAIQSRLEEINGTAREPPNFDELHEILEEQHYQLARWQAGARGSNYRRFFAIDSMVGMRMEIPDVFRESHLLMASLIRKGRTTGLRIDHIDGLWDPQDYLERVQGLRPEAEAGSPPLYVVVEKILAGTETLPESWPVHGTTGYDFITQLGRLFVDARAEDRLEKTYARFVGSSIPFAEVVYSKKRLVLEDLFAGAVASLTTALSAIVESDRRWRDFTAHELAIAVREIMACMSVYRTFRGRDGAVRPDDLRELEQTCDRAIRRNPRLDPQPFQFVRDVLAQARPEHAPPAQAARLNAWALMFQQYTGAVTAKAVEDTAFYVFNRLIALNEVGGDPSIFGGSVSDFHAANQRRRSTMPHSLLATSTHDTKLSEDVRARLYVLSEIPDEWEAWIEEWKVMNARHKTILEGRSAPDANEEYRLYQILLGAWPLDNVIDDAFRGRIRGHLRKAVSEAKENTTWHRPNEAWLQAGDHFIDAVLSENSGNAFISSIGPKAQRLADLGRINSLSQLVLKITCPGIPDFYQGNEIWDFSLVDPDNRRPVDYEKRLQLLSGLKERPLREMMRHWKDGGIKLRTMQALLAFRRSHAELFRNGDYHPLPVSGRFADHVIAFSRRQGGESLLVIVPRLTARIGCPPLGLIWDDTVVRLEAEGGEASEIVAGIRFSLGRDVALADVFRALPFFVAHLA